MKHKSMALLALVALLMPPSVLGFGEKEVVMEASAPMVGIEVTYKRTWDGGKKSETYTVHCQEIEVAGEPAYQSVSVYRDRVRRVTMRAEDLVPIAMSEVWNSGDKRIERRYQGGKVRSIRVGAEPEMDVTVDAPEGVHDTESFAFLLKGYPFKEQHSVAPIDVLIAEPNPAFSKPRVFSINIIPRGREKVKVPAGEFDCYKFEMSFAGLLGYVLPENTFWLLAEEPHMFVKASSDDGELLLLSAPKDCDGVKYCAVAAEPPGLSD